MSIIYISLLAVVSFAFSVFLVVIGEEIGLWAGILFFAGAVALSWFAIKTSLSRY